MISRLFVIAIIGVTLTSAPAFAADYPKVRVITSAGDFLVELDDARAPLTVANFLQYVRDGHYEDTIFHRVVNNFVIQGGGYSLGMEEKKTQESVVNESGNGLSNQRLTIAMARTNDPHSADAQFYINLADNVALDPLPTRWGYAVFGNVTEGAAVVDEIGHRAVRSEGQFQHLPDVPVVIERMVIVADDKD
ncbi:MAG: peptidylprolyl isomerase [Gammaproteobacteria bacterium]